MNQRQKGQPTVIAYISIKGRSGKSSTAILTADFLGAAGKRVLMIDLDHHNASTFYYLADLDSVEEEILSKNTAEALRREENRLDDYSILTAHKGVSLIASSLGLVDLRSINAKQLLRMIPTLAGFYDIVIIDTPSDYNNLVLNAMYAADLIITPVLRDMESFNAAAFLQMKIALETDKTGNWFITINGYDKQYEEVKGGKQRDYIDMYQNYFSRHLTSSETWFPWSVNPVKGAAHNPKLYQAVAALGCFIDEDPLPRVQI